MKKICLLLIIPLFLYSASIEIEEAQLFAINFMNTIGHANTQIARTNTTLIDNEPVLYQFNFENGGFIILAADDGAFPVIGFSLINKLDFDEPNKSLQEFLNNYQSHILRIRKNNLSSSDLRYNWLEKSVSENIVTQKEKVEPLLTTKWGQEYPYNKFCPEDLDATGGYNGRVPAGCVAIAMGQIMNFWEYPKRGIGEHYYIHEKYGEQYANFDTTYNWAIMKDILQPSDEDSLQNAIASLVYHLGVAVEMDYHPDGSGAYSSWVPDILKENFNYSEEIRMKYKDYTSASVWIEDLYDEMVNNRPVYYAGSGDDGGHAFVFDGYWEQEGMDFFHVNWGWSGTGDGWYVLNSLNPDDMLFNTNQRSILYIEPAEPMARFTANVMEGLQPLEVTFKDISTGKAVQWFWEFGDGDTSYTQNPTHIYEDAGLYDVKLTIVDSSGFISEPKILENFIFVKAKNELYGRIAETRILDSDVVQVLDDVTITKTGKLVINPGVELQFQGNYQIKNFGVLEANGTADSTITFSAVDTTIGWSGILSQKSSSDPVITRLKHCQISNVNSQRALSAINGVSVELADVVFERNFTTLFYNISSDISVIGWLS